SRVAGAGTTRTALSITIPVMAPVVLSVFLLGTMVSLQTFEVEQVLGVPFRFFVFSTMIYDLLVTRVPRYDAATALAVLVLAAMLPLVFTQQWLTRGRRYTTITGQFQSRRHRLGRWRWPAFALMLALVLVVLGVPLVFAGLGRAGVAAVMPLGVQLTNCGLTPLGGDPARASRVAAASWSAPDRPLMLRPMAPNLLAAAMITFVGAARNIGNIALLATSAN